MKIKNVLKLITGLLIGLYSLWLLSKATARKKAKVKKITGPHYGNEPTWFPVMGDKHSVIVVQRTTGNPVKVELPEGVTSDQVASVALPNKSEAEVVIKHETMDSHDRSISGDPNASMDI